MQTNKKTFEDLNQPTTNLILKSTDNATEDESASVSVLSEGKTVAQLHHGDALSKLAQIAPQSIDLILTDLPYGVTQNKWDIPIPFDEMWAAYSRVLKPRGAVVLTATQPFTSLLVASNLSMFKYEWIWEKSIGSGQLNIKHQPLRAHESILVFYKKIPTYNEPLSIGAPYKIQRKLKVAGTGYGTQRDSEKENTGFRHARTTLFVPNPRVKGGHPTQKPVALMELLINTYTNKGDTVLDCCMGSGTTGVAAVKLGRSFIGVELDANWFNRAVNRIVKEGTV